MYHRTRSSPLRRRNGQKTHGDDGGNLCKNLEDPAFSALSQQLHEDLLPNIGNPPYPSLHH